MAILFTLRVFARNLLRGNRRRNTFHILFWCLARGSNPGFSSNKPIHYLLDHGDFLNQIFRRNTVTLCWIPDDLRMHCTDNINMIANREAFLDRNLFEVYQGNRIGRNILITHTYIHNWSLQPFSQDYDLASHTTYVVCVNFMHE